MLTHFAYSSESDTREAFAEVCSGLGEDTPSCVFLWLNPGYDLELLASLIQEQNWPAVLSATTAGVINSGKYHTQGMSLAALYSSEMKAHTWLVRDLHNPDKELEQLSASIEELHRQKPAHREMFATLLIDGMSQKEEDFTGKLYPILGQIPLVGGSAGDGLQFIETQIYQGGRYHSGAALVAVFETSIPFRLFKVQHHRLTSHKVVVTEVDANRRLVRGLSGRPAGITYGTILGVPASDLTSEQFSSHSLALTVGDEVYVRSVHSMGEDHSLSFFCSLDPGSVLTVARSQEPVETLHSRFQALETDLGSLGFVLSFDCILRRLEFERSGLLDQVEALLAQTPGTGFCTYGEQFNALHMNQTMVGVAFART